jgi:alpha-glucosidase
VASSSSFATVPWWRRGVVYQVYVRSFQDTDGDGVGDLRGVVGRLEYLTGTLGVDAVWLTPFYRSPMVDSGYDVADHTEVDPVYGDLETFDELVARAHERGLKILVDYVATNTSDQHPWFHESRASRASGKRDWYIWRDPKPDGGLPNNWLSMWGGPAWTLDGRTGQFYLHAYHPRIPDLNWHEPEVRRAMLDVARFWLERGVDGFRVDAAPMLMKDRQLRDNPPSAEPNAGLHKPMGEYGSQLHLHDRCHPELHDVLRELRRLVDSSGDRDRVLIGEAHSGEWHEWVRYFGADLDELHIPHNFGLLAVGSRAAAVRGVVDGLEAALPVGAWPNYVLGNHDESRVASRVGQRHARLLMMLLLTLRGTPTLYYGDELGLPDAPVPPESVRDPWEKGVPGLGLGRDPARSPMPWSRRANAGFCGPGATLWLPLVQNHAALSVEAQLGDRRSMLTLTRQLLALRRREPALAIGDYRPVSAPEGCFVYVRESAERKLVVALNFDRDEHVVDAPNDGHMSAVTSTMLDREPHVERASLLRAGEGCVYEVIGG